MEYFKNHPDAGKIVLCDKEEDAISDTGAIMIICDWPEFRELTPKIIENFPGGGLIMDGRRMLEHDYEELAGKGYDIIAVGSPIIKRKD